MAEEGEELELAEEEETGGSKKKLFIIIGAVALLLLVGGGAAFFMLGGDEEPAEGEEGVEELVEEAVIMPAIYVSLDPTFTVNLQSGSRAKYLKIALQVLVRDPLLEEAVKTHAPAIRNQLVLMFSSKSSQDLESTEGKQALQKEALEIIQTVLKESADMEGVEQVLFNSFVMQ